MIPLENSPVLVTGGAGFVGSNLVRRLVREGARVTVLDDLFTGRLENLPPRGFEFVQGSVCEPRIVEKLVGARPKRQFKEMIDQLLAQHAGSA